MSGYLEMDLTDEFEQDIIGIYWSHLDSYEFAEKMVELVEKYRDKKIRTSKPKAKKEPDRESVRSVEEKPLKEMLRG